MLRSAPLGSKMAKHGNVLVLLVSVSLCAVLTGASEQSAPASSRRDVNQVDAKRAQRARCVSCSVNGQLYDGHSRFQYEEGCNRYRCVCRCDGSWDCPAQYTENICDKSAKTQEEKHSQPSSSSSVSSSSSTPQRSDEQCRSCVVNGKEQQGHSYFTFVEGCVTIDSCICYCNGSWVCSQERARNTCAEGALPGGASERTATWKVEIENSHNSSSSGSSGSSYVNSESGRSSGSSSGGSSSISDSSRGSSSVDVSSRDRHNTRRTDDQRQSFTGCQNCTAAGKVIYNTRRTDDQRQSFTGCQNCTAAGKVILGNSYFELEDGCRKMKHCSCYCNGSWNCPDRFVENTCGPDSTATPREQQSGCRTCSVKGKTFPGNQYFQITDGCIEYKNCICNCDGSWNCPDTGARNICDRGEAYNVDALSGSSCRQCEVKGQIFPGNKYFQLTDGCIEYRNCICRCDGSWSCPDDSARNKCQERGEGTAGSSSCGTCEVYGSTFPGNKYFQVKQGCTEYRNCICHCNGTWHCPGDSAVNACDSKTSSSSSLDGNDAASTSISDCSSCTVYGKNFKGGDYFDIIDGCTSYRNCICRCDGSWNCNSRFATNICNNDTRRVTENRGSEVERTDYRNISRTSSVSSTDNQCSFCNAKNKIVRGNSYFEVTDGCIEYKNCLCKCDGSWECPSQFSKNICIESNRSSGISPTTCSNCVAKEKVVRGNSYFELIDGCIRYTSCRCNCDGKWECPEQRAQNICFTNTTVSDNGCSLCQSSDGTVHQPNSRFTLKEGCIEYNCDCFCNGSWSCPGKRSRWICQDKCLQCDVNGRKVQNNTQFVHKTGCLEYTCDCHCNGSWSCPGSTVRNTCPVGTRDGCNKCTVSSAEVYEGESDFVLKQGCLHYKCRCNCDGSYSCPGKEARNVCRGEVLGGCRSCAVSETEIYKGETDFTMRKECINYECKCNCDGSWECPAEKARNTCLGEVSGGCRTCRVSETESYRANAIFDMRKDCIHYKCKCNCDGSWSCPGEDARDVCKGEVPGGCKSCIISDNEFYLGNSNFEMVKNCIHYKCKCNCDGSYSCPGKTARRVCQAGAVADAPTCRFCKISETEQFTGNTTFHLERGCARYECECKCDGSWQCPPAKTRDVCARDDVRTISPARCSPCKISKEIYPGSSSFKFTRGCSQFDCKCECSGRWSCDHKNRVNICRTGEQATTERSLVSDASAIRRQDITASGSTQVAAQTSQRGSTYAESDIQAQEVYSSQDRYASRTNTNRSTSFTNSGSTIDSNCRPCNADGKTYQPNVVFSLDRGCLQYTNCKCFCDGRWQCAEELNRCGTTHTPVLSQGERSHRTDTRSFLSNSTTRREVDSSAWVFVDGVDTSFKTDDERTGGGYAVQVDTKYSPSHSARGQGRQRLEQLEEQPSASSSFTASGPSSSSSTFITSGSSPDRPLSSPSVSTSYDSTGTNQCLRCQVDSKTYPSGANFDMRRGCVIYKCLCLCSGSYRCRLTSDNACSTQDKQKTCSNCLYQGMVFPGNMGFTVREGCEEKQCNCNCDGTHACHSSKPIPGCTDATANAPGFSGHGNFYPVPGGLYPASTGYITNTGRAVYQTTCTTCIEPGSGPVVYHAPVHPAFGEGGGGFINTEHKFNVGQGIPRETCSGCFIDGQARDGNSTFTFEKDCIEFDCYCACGGSWNCAGRMAIDCTAGFAPDTVPHTTGCRSCIVQGTAYPANARFSLKQGCHEYQCSCNCDGGWSCPAQHPVNLCPSTPTRPVRGNVMDPQIVREDTYLADQGIVNNEAVKVGEVRQISNDGYQSNSKEFKTVADTCYACEVRGVTYQARSKFFLRDGCIQRICECHCNKSWSCLENTVDICKMAASEGSNANSVQCRDCRVGSDVYVSENNFQINNGCFQHNCYCYCNGTHDCPKERVRDICNPDTGTSAGERTGNDRHLGARVHQSILTKENGDVIVAGKIPGCKECDVDGHKIEALSSFVKQLGCYESLCHCQCNGKAVCPPSASVNVCELPDKLPMNERKGCQVGRRTHFTRVFAHVENCIQRTCVCHDNGEWSCKRTANDIKVC